VLSLQAHRDFAASVPTSEHFIPMLYLAALADQAGETPEVLVEGYAHGSLSMTAYTLDVACPPHESSTAGSVPLPDPHLLPPEETNA
jgi:4,5-DOPA dioxygenase extradiol